MPIYNNLIVRVIKVRAFILDLGDRTDYAETVSETRGDIALPEVLARQCYANPTAKGR
jgi:hypothetical protein